MTIINSAEERVNDWLSLPAVHGCDHFCVGHMTTLGLARTRLERYGGEFTPVFSTQYVPF